MVTKDFNRQDYDDNDDAEQRLSFSDLPLNSSFSYSTEYQTSSFEQDNLFEFFSEDFTASSANYNPTNHIIFCGKLIPVADQQMVQPKPPRKENSTFPLKMKSHSFSKTVSEEHLQHEKRFKSCRSFPVIQDDYQSKRERYDISRKKTTIPASSRWNILFGSFPMEMKLRDIKTRQNKRKPATIFRSDEKNEMVKNVRSKKMKGLWGLLRVLAFA